MCQHFGATLWWPPPHTFSIGVVLLLELTGIQTRTHFKMSGSTKEILHYNPTEGSVPFIYSVQWLYTTASMGGGGVLLSELKWVGGK